MEGTDPFDDLVLDETFVRAAPHREPSAEERFNEARHAEAMLRIRPSVVVPERRRRRPRALWVVAAVALVLGGLAAARPDRTRGGGPSGWGGADRFVLDGEVTRFPSPPIDVSDEPLALPPIVPEGGVHAFVRTVDGEPVRWDPCREISVVVAGGERIDGSDSLLSESLTMISRATGLQFVVEGETDERPTDTSRSPVQDRYGDRWAPVLVAWTDSSEVAGLEGSVIGLAGAQPISTPGSSVEVFVTGVVHLDTPALASMLSSHRGYEKARAVVLHELGHLVGLDHVEAPSEIMHESAIDQVGFGPGDRVGLSALGGGPCVAGL